MEKQVLFDLKIKDESLAAALSKVTAEEKALKTEMAELSKNYEKNSAEIDSNKAKINQLSKEKSALIGLTSKEIEKNKAATGSLNQMKAEIILLTAQYDKLSKEQRESADVGGKLQRQIRVLNDDLKEQKNKLGDNRLSIGGYKDAILEAAASSGKFGQGINSISLAFKANPIGLIITALTVLLPLLNKSAGGADFLAKSFAQVTSVVEVIVKRVFTLGSALVEVFKGNLPEAMRLASEGISGFGTEVKNAWTESGKLADALDALEAKERAFAVAQKVAETQIKQLLIQAKNRTLSEEERIKLLERAERLESSVNNKALKFAQERLRIEKENNKLRQEDRDVQEQREVEFAEKIEEIRQNGLEIQERIQVRLDALQEVAAQKQLERQEFLESKALSDSIKRAEEYGEKLLIATIDQDDKVLKQIESRLDKGVELNQKADEKTLKEKERVKQAEINIENEKFDAIFSITNAASALSEVVLGKSKAGLAVQKGIALFELSINTARAIASGIASSQSVPFPGNIIAVASTLATVFANIAQAKQLLSTANASFYDGGMYGYTGDGDAREQSTNLGKKPYAYHKGELIVNNKTLSSPEGSYHAGVLLEMMKKQGTRIKGIAGFANGGLYDGGYSIRQASAGVDQLNNTGNISANSAVAAAKNTRIVVKVDHINKAQSEERYVRVESDLR